MKNLFNSFFLFLAFATTAFSQTPPGNTGLYFDGVDDYVNFNSNSNLNFAGKNAFTFEAWVKLAVLSKEQVIVSKNGLDQGQLAIKGYINDQGALLFEMANTGQVASVFTTGPDVIPVKKWMYVAFVSDGSGSNQIFVNGVSQKTSTNSVSSFLSASASTLNWRVGEGFWGEIDEVRIFGSARSSSLIVSDMESVANNGAITYLNLDIGTGQIAKDLGVSPKDANIGLSPTAEGSDPLWAYRITNTTDSDKNQGSLRWAITQAELDADKDYIDFSIQQTDLTTKGVSTIQQTADFPIIKQALIIDGYSAYGSSVNTNLFTKGTNAQIRTELVGASLLKIFNVTSNGSLIKGLSFLGGDVAINLAGTNNQIAGNFFGLGVDGSVFTASFGTSVINLLGSNNTIGTLSAATNFADLNVITQAKIKGVSITSNNSSVRNNYIGTSVTGLNQVYTPNAIWLENTNTGVVIEGNCIISNSAINFQTIGTGPWVSSSTSIINNLMGVFVDGSTFNAMDKGVYVLNASTSSLIKGNTIANARSAAIDISNQAFGHKLTSNEIYCSESSAILLNTSGNNSKEMPVITVASPTLISGKTTGLTDSVEIFIDNLLVCGTANQGRTFLGKVQAAAGIWSYSPKPSLAAGTRITATAAEDKSGTSPFSETKTVAVVCNPLLVTSVADDGVCGTLRNAIEFANSNPGKDTVRFNITGGTLPYIINLTSELPALKDIKDITNGTVIDGFSQLGSKPNTVHPLAATTITPMNAVYGILLNGVVSSTGSGFLLAGNNNVISGLILYNFGDPKTGVKGRAISIVGTGNKVLGCQIGLDESGKSSSVTNIGVIVTGSGNTIGDATVSGANIISGVVNSGQGIYFAASLNAVKGNMIGLQKDGSSLVAGNEQAVGVYLGSTAGISSIGGTLKGEGNVISGNNLAGINAENNQMTGNVISGNTIGTQANGSELVLGNKQLYGVYLNNTRNVKIGGATADESNLISGNQSFGVYIVGLNGVGNTIYGNYIGLDKSGTSIVVGATQTHGIFIGSEANSNTIGGELPGQGNVISGNDKNGINIESMQNNVYGNIIGLQKDGLTYLAKHTQQNGVYISAATNTIGGNSAAVRNVISGNVNSGVFLGGISATTNSVKGNYIGTNSSGSAVLGSSQTYGVFINNGAFSNKIGVAAAGEGNLIAYNGTGIYASGGGIGNVFSANSIHSNTLKGININYGTVQANNGKKIPVVSAINGNVITGTCEAGDVVEVYNDSPQSGTTDQGRIYLGTAGVSGTTWTFTSATAMSRVTALARDTKNGSSEFSLAKVSTMFRPFITTWETTVAKETITIPTTGKGYNYTVSWGDGTTSTETGDAIHVYTKADVYKISISGAFPRIYFKDKGDTRIKSIDQWGDIAWASMSYAFDKCTNLNCIATDAPDLSGVTDMSSMFRYASSFNGKIDHWDVSTITDMGYMFFGAKAFNQPLNSWKVNNVTAMHLLFVGNLVFNQPLDNWDVSNVTDMSSMFSGCHQFNQDLGGWKVNKVKYMSAMFYEAKTFNKSLSAWKVDSVTDMSYMFNGAIAFNQDISSWNVSKVTDMSQMFFGAYAFNQPLNSWNVNNVTEMGKMFQSAQVFNKDLSDWKVSNVTNMSEMFLNASAFDQSLKNWNITSVTTMANMLDFTNISVANYDSTLIGWSAQSVKSDVVLGASGLKYCNSALEKASLISKYKWVITDAGLNCPLVLEVNSTGISQTGFTATWTNMGVNTTYELEIAKDIAFTSILIGYPKIAIKDTFSLVTGLNANTTYHYRVRKTGDLVFSAYKTIITLPLLAPATVCAIKVGQTVEINWTQVVGAAGYTISYGTDSTASTLNVFSAGNTTNAVISANISLTKTNYFSVKAIDGKASGFKAAFGVVAGTAPRVCSGTLVILKATSPTGSIISWNQNVKDGVAFTPLVGSVLYTVSASLKGCISTDTVRVIVDALPVLTVVNPSPVCSPNTVDLTGAAVSSLGVLTYWSDALAKNPLTNFTAVGTGKYYVKATSKDNSACSVIKPVDATVNVTPTLSLTSTNPSICQAKNGSISVGGLATGVKYAWSYKNTLSELVSDSSVANPLGIILISNALNSGTYADVSISAKGCASDKGVVNLIDPNAPDINVGTAQTVCSGTPVILKATSLTTGATISWDKNVKDGVPFTPAVGSQVYIATASSLGCNSSASVQVIVDALPVLTVVNPSAVCSPNTVDLTGAAVSSLGVLTYWSDALAKNPLTNFTAVGTGKYYVKATNVLNTSCSVIKPVDATVNVTPILSLTSTNPLICQAENGSISLGGLVLGVKYAWSYKNTLSELVSDSSVANLFGNILISNTLKSGTYADVSISAKGCTSVKQTVDLTDPNAPILNLGTAQRVCSGTPVILKAISLPTGAKISWDKNVQDGVPFIPAVGSQVYIATASLLGCSSSASVQVTVDSVPVLTVKNPSVVCSPNTVDLTAKTTVGTISYWKDELAVTSLTNFKAVGSGKYYVKATSEDNSACFVIKTVDVSVNVTPNLSLTSTNPAKCQDKNGSISVGGLATGVKYAWSYKNTLGKVITDSSIAISGIILISDALNSGTYTDVSISAKGCTSELQSVIITDPNAPNIDAGLAQRVCSGTPISLIAKNLSNALITWGGGVKDGEMFVPKTGNVLYTVTATLLGCSSSDTVRVIVDSVPVLNVVNPAAICSSSAVDLTSSVTTTVGTISYWKDQITQIPLTNFKAVGTGKYYIKAINSDNQLCFVVDSVEVTEIAKSDKKLSVSINNGQSLINSRNMNLLSFTELSKTSITHNTSLGEVQFLYKNDALKIDYLPKSNQFGKDTLKVSLEDICSTIVSDTFIITLQKTKPTVVEVTVVKEINVFSISSLSIDLSGNQSEIRIIKDASYSSFLSFETYYLDDGLNIDTALKVKVNRATLPARFKKDGGDVVDVFYRVCDINGTNCGDTLSLSLRINLEDLANITIVDGNPDFSGFKNKKVKDLLEIEVVNNALSRNRGLKFDYKWDGKQIASDSLEFDISIYSRWGDLVYHELGEGENVNWHGEYQSDGATVFETVEDGNYFWILSVKYKIGEDKYRYGFKTGYLYYVDVDFEQ